MAPRSAARPAIASKVPHIGVGRRACLTTPRRGGFEDTIHGPKEMEHKIKGRPIEPQRGLLNKGWK